MPDHTELTIRETTDERTSGIVFGLRDALCQEAHGIMGKMAELLACHHLAMVLPDFSGAEMPDESRFRTIMEKLREYYRSYSPGFCCYAEGRFGNLVTSCLDEGGNFEKPPLLYCLLVFPYSKDKEAEAAGFSCDNEREDETVRTVQGVAEVDNYALIFRFGLASFVRTFPFASEVERDSVEMTDRNETADSFREDRSFQAASFFIRHFEQAEKRTWEIVSDADHYNDDAAVLAHVLCTITLKGCPEAPLRIKDLADEIERDICREGVPEKAKRDMEEERDLIHRTADIIREKWKSSWPDRCFWEAVAADSGHPGSRRRLFDHLVSDFNEQEREKVLASLREEAQEGHSYASIFLGVLAEMKEPGDPEMALSFYREAAGYADPEGDYRIGRLLEYRLNQTERAIFFYRKASDAGYLPAMVRMTSHLEKKQSGSEDRIELIALYEEIAYQFNLFFAWKRLGELQEEDADFYGAAEAYRMPQECERGIEREEKNWSYGVGTDRYGIFPADYDFQDTDACEMAVRLGKLLMKDPDLLWDVSALDVFREAAEYVLGVTLNDKEEIEDCIAAVRRQGDTSADAGEAVFYAGLCSLKGIGCKQHAGKAFACFRLAGELGYAGDTNYVDFLNESEEFLRSVQKKPSGKERRQEALYRLKLLTLMGMDERIYQRFEQEGVISFISDEGEIDIPDPDDERDGLILKEIRRMEQLHHATAYLVSLSYVMTTVDVSMFYVSSEASEWQFDRDQLSDMSPFVYAFNIDPMDDETSIDAEIGPIGIAVSDSGMERFW